MATELEVTGISTKKSRGKPLPPCPKCGGAPVLDFMMSHDTYYYRCTNVGELFEGKCDFHTNCFTHETVRGAEQAWRNKVKREKNNHGD